MEPNAFAHTSAYTLSKRAYYADLFIVPVATAVAVAWLFSNHKVHTPALIAAVVAGFGAWTFVEYAVHRWVFHGAQGRREHALHHVAPDDFIGFSAWTTSAIGALLFWALTVSLGPCLGVGLLVGLVFGYLAYIIVHDRIHHGNLKGNSYLARLNANHEYHHRRFGANYGVTTPFWDMVFGTFQQPRTKTQNKI